MPIGLFARLQGSFNFMDRLLARLARLRPAFLPSLLIPRRNQTMQAIPSPQEVHKVLDENNTLTVSAVANTAKAQPRRASTTVDAISVEDMAKHLCKQLQEKISYVYSTSLNLFCYTVKSRILWHPSMDTIIIITKARDNRLVRYTRRLVEWLISTRRFGKEYPFTV